MNTAAAVIVLASSSEVRQRLLRNAGIAFEIDVPNVDEESVKQSLRSEGAGAGQVAETLAELKAVVVSRRHADRLVIGADQTLECNDIWFDKPPDLDHARGHLMALSGKTHALNSAVCVVKDGVRLWHHNATALLTMRPLSDAFIDGYLETTGDDVCGSVGAYRLEGPGAQLFSSIDGDYFTILGLPLLPLLGFLRGREVLAS